MSALFREACRAVMAAERRVVPVRVWGRAPDDLHWVLGEEA